ncbi:hypothetical protein JNJ66_05035 [Candidatus Saccharibacteria bacterium]|nr:hypothetical protein [Candidatus Saccharibacteria bacterium]
MSSTYIHILGRQPALGLAELEAAYGSAQVAPAGRSAALLTLPAAPEDEVEALGFHRLGGSIKVGRLLDRTSATAWPQIIRHLEQHLDAYLADIPEGKLKFGISLYGLPVAPRKLGATALDLKKQIRSGGRSVRIIPNQDTALSSAQVLHNNLTGPLGFELLVVNTGRETLIGRTLNCQYIEAYAARDYGRPKRDAFVGMLPPKLAQIMINLAAGPLLRQRQTDEPEAAPRLLDPFCGTGVVLQEALLMGLSAYGTDVSERMIDFSRTNLQWLPEQFPAAGIEAEDVRLEPGDATTHQWQPPINCVAAETYLGQPMQQLPAPARFDRIVADVDELHRRFFVNLAAQLPAGTPLCVAVPAWRLTPAASAKAPGYEQFRHLPVIDELASLGYNQTDFSYVARRDMLYFREDQVVARELLVLEKR